MVEPDEADRAFLVSILTSAGFLVSEADGFTAGRAQILRHPPTVLVTEIRLGFHNGLHLAHLARWRGPQMHLVLMSRHRDPVLIRDAQALGAAFVQKPLTPEALLTSVDSSLAQRPARQPDGRTPAGPPTILRWRRAPER